MNAAFAGARARQRYATAAGGSAASRQALRRTVAAGGADGFGYIVSNSWRRNSGSRSSRSKVGFNYATDVEPMVPRAEALAANGVFLGGPARDFERLGRLQFATLVEHGLWPDSKVIDIGCGALRAGYWLLHFLEPGCYFGLEPNREMVELGIREFLEPHLLERAQPRWAHNEDFDFNVFGVQFDFFLARSIWTHASKRQISKMLDGFVATAAPTAVMLASYFKKPRISRGEKREYLGDEWVGRSHTRNRPGRAYHSYSWIESECRRRGLGLLELDKPPVNDQRWLRIDFITGST